MVAGARTRLRNALMAIGAGFGLLFVL